MMQTHTIIEVRTLALFSGNALRKLAKFNEAIIMYDHAL